MKLTFKYIVDNFKQAFNYVFDNTTDNINIDSIENDKELKNNCKNKKSNNNTTTNNKHKHTKIYKIKLKDSHKDQYYQILSDFKPEILHAKSSIESQIPSWIMYLIKFNYNRILKKQNKEFISIIESMSEILDIQPYLIMIFNCSYEMFCTSVIAQDSKTGNIILGRNLDYYFKDLLANLSYIADIYDKNNKKIARIQSMAGLAGIINGMRYNKYAVSLNQKNSDCLKEKMYKFSQGSKTLPYALYEGLITNDSYDKIRNYYKTIDIDAPAYFIIAGVKQNKGVYKDKQQGSVIVRFLENKRARERTLDVKNNVWYLVQTNYDESEPKEEWDERKIPMENKLDKIKKFNSKVKSKSKEKVIDVNTIDKLLKQKPNYVKGETIYTTIMCAKKGVFNTSLY